MAATCSVRNVLHKFHYRHKIIRPLKLFWIEINYYFLLNACQHSILSCAIKCKFACLHFTPFESWELTLCMCSFSYNTLLLQISTEQDCLDCSLYSGRRFSFLLHRPPRRWTRNQAFLLKKEDPGVSCYQ